MKPPGKTPLDRHPLFRVSVAAGFGVLAALLMIALKIYWFAHPPDGKVFLGYQQGDQKIYACLIRAAMQSPNGFTYAYPWDLSPNPPAIFFQLPITLMAWLARAFPTIPFHDLFDVFRVLFSAAMFASLAVLIQIYFPSRRMYWIVYSIVAMGGGIAWIAAICLYPSWPTEAKGSLLLAQWWLEDHYHWWFLNIFRNVFYPFEVFYHFLFLGMVVSLLRGHRGWALVWYAMGLASNPFLGVHLSAILIPTLLMDWWKSPNAVVRLVSCGAVGLVMLVLAYYKLFLGHWEVGRSLEKLHAAAATEPLSAKDAFLGYGPFLVLLLASLFNLQFLKRQCRRRGRRILLIWIGTTAFLVNNSRFIKPGLQPMHFTRGYLFLPLVLWSFQYLKFVFQPSLRRFPRRWAAGFSTAAMLLILDTIIFAVKQPKYVASEDAVFFSQEAYEVISRFQGYKERIYVLDYPLSLMLTAKTGCPTFWGDQFVTPDYKQREAEIVQLAETGDFASFWNKYHVATFVMPLDAYFKARDAFSPPRCKIVLQNARYIIVRWPGADSPNR